MPEGARRPEPDPWSSGWVASQASARGTIVKQIQYHEQVLVGLRERLARLQERERSIEEWLGESVYELMPAHVELAGILESHGIFTVRDLLQSNRDRLLSISGVSAVRFKQIMACLAKAGFDVPESL